MTALAVASIIGAVALFVLGCMNQRTVYWKMTAWQYRNPEANEPSDAALGVNRFGFFFGCAALFVTAAMLLSYEGEQTYSTAQVRAVAEAVASDLDQGSTPGIGSSISATSEVYDAVREEGDGRVKVDYGSGGYELTNVDGKNPVCLTVDVDSDLKTGSGLGGSDADELWSHSVSASVADGPC